METGLNLKQVELALDGIPLFDPLSVTVAKGEIVTVMGPSGSGKSTLLSAICGTLDPAFDLTGDIELDGQSLRGRPAETRRVGILFQDDLLFPHLSVGDNLAFGLPEAMARRDRRSKVEEALSEAGLEGFAKRNPATLSGGQRARIACLRALLAEPCTLLLDEPFSKLDAELRDRFRRFVFDHAVAKSLPVLLVTHDPDDAAAAAGRIIRLGAI